jgi:hypothetical protein
MSNRWHVHSDRYFLTNEHPVENVKVNSTGTEWQYKCKCYVRKTELITFEIKLSWPVLDLLLCLGVLKYRVPLAGGGGTLPCQHFFLRWIFLWCNPKFKGVLFRCDSRHNDRVVSLWECATKLEVMTVAQWHRNQLIRGPLVIGEKCLKWIHAYVVQF